MNRIDKKFRELRRRPAFIPYLTAGYPDLLTTEKLIYKLKEAGADIIELGVPFSDPVADGLTIQASSQWALNRGVTLKKILKLVRRLRKKTPLPIVLMSYYNPVLHYGKKFLKEAAAAGVDGLIIPDLPVEESVALSQAAAASSLNLILLAAPTTPTPRLKKIISLTRGYLYYVSLTGVTGERKQLPAGLQGQLKYLKKISRTPVAVGFGFSRPAQLKKIKNLVGGVIVGSAIIGVMSKNLKKKRPVLIKKTLEFCQSLKKALN
jgi:tryptophan synthase alpha chain